MGNLNWIDFIILGIFAFSILKGFLQGFMKEVISLCTWIAACVVATMFSSKLAGMFAGSSADLQNAIGSSAGSIGANAAQGLSMLSIGISFVVLFMGTLLIGSILNYMVSAATTASGLGFFNRLLGGAFGGVRGYVINVVLIFVVQLTPLAAKPVWAQSQLVGMFQPAVSWFSNMVSPTIESLRAQAQSAVSGVSSQMQNVGSVLQGITK